MLRFIASISFWAKRIANFAAIITVAFVALILLLQVTLRYLFSYSLPWPEEASRFAIIWVVLLMGSVLVRDQQLVTVDFFDRLWPKRVIFYRDLAYRMMLLVVLGVLFREGLSQAIAGWNMWTTALEIRWFWPYLAVPVGAGLMLVQMVCLTIEEVEVFFRKRKMHD